MYQLVELALIIRHGDEADPRLVWDSYRFRCSKLLMSFLEEEELEATVKVIPIPWYHRGLGLVWRPHPRTEKFLARQFCISTTRVHDELRGSNGTLGTNWTGADGERMGR